MSFPIDFGALVSGEGGLTATGSTQATALPLTRQVSVFASVPAGAGTILPSSYAAGTRLTVVNRDASNTLSIYPASGDEIESLGINSAFTLSPGGDATFISFAPPLAPAPRQWFQVNTLSAAPTITGGTINGATIGLTTPAAGSFTTLSASGTVSGTGFSTYLASPPAIGGTAAGAGTFTALVATGTSTLGNASANHLTITGGATGSAPTLTATGSDTNIPLVLTPKGASPVVAPVLQLGTFFTATGNNVLSVGQYPVNYTTTVDPMAKFFMTPGGTVTSSQSFYNQFSITDGVNASGDIYGLYVGHSLGSTNVHGGRAAFVAQMTVSTTPGDTNQNYVGSESTFQTNVAVASSGFGRAVAAVLQTGATGWGELIGDEIDTSIQAGASALYRHNLQLVLTSDDKIAASIENIALSINAQENWTGHGFDVGISFGSSLGWWGFPTTATLIGTQAGAAGTAAYVAAIGIDFSAVTFSTAFLKSNGFFVDGSGNETVLTTTTHVYTAATLPTVGTKGRRAFVSDATATTFGTTVAGGGTNNVPVFDNGTSWVIG